MGLGGMEPSDETREAGTRSLIERHERVRGRDGVTRRFVWLRGEPDARAQADRGGVHEQRRAFARLCGYCFEDG